MGWSQEESDSAFQQATVMSENCVKHIDAHITPTYMHTCAIKTTSFYNMNIINRTAFNPCYKRSEESGYVSGLLANEVSLFKNCKQILRKNCVEGRGHMV